MPVVRIPNADLNQIHPVPNSFSSHRPLAYVAIGLLLMSLVIVHLPALSASPAWLPWATALVGAILWYWSQREQPTGRRLISLSGLAFLFNHLYVTTTGVANGTVPGILMLCGFALLTYGGYVSWRRSESRPVDESTSA